jgi:hypothetical protein
LHFFSVPGEGYSRNDWCGLDLISTFLLDIHAILYCITQLQKDYFIEKRQTIKWLKEKGEKHKQWFTNFTLRKYGLSK